MSSNILFFLSILASPPTTARVGTLRQQFAAKYAETAVVVDDTPTEAQYAVVVGGTFIMLLLFELAVLVILDLDNIVSQSRRGYRNCVAIFTNKWENIR